MPTVSYEPMSTPAPSYVELPYVELQVTSNFSFLRGAAHPEELAAQAAALGHPAIAITDRNTLAGVVRGHSGAKTAGIQLIVGARHKLREFQHRHPEYCRRSVGFSLVIAPGADLVRIADARADKLLTLPLRDV